MNLVLNIFKNIFGSQTRDASMEAAMLPADIHTISDVGNRS
jgi:hypothetical protein